MKLQNLVSITKKKSKRIGRGRGSGKGDHTVGRGQKGQKSRSGYRSPRRGFEGGQMPLYRRIPKLRGFRRGRFANKRIVFNVSDFNELKPGAKINLSYLTEIGFLGTNKKIEIKILGQGDLTKEIHVEGIDVSTSAKEKIEANGGSVK